MSVQIRSPISFKFDINKFLENRRKIKLDQLKNICPHVRISHKGGKAFSVESYFSSPVGTRKWICSRCGCVVESGEDADKFTERYKKDIKLDDLKLHLKKEKKFIKKAKKLKLC